MYSNQKQNAAFQKKMEELYPTKGKRQNSYLRSLVLIFIIVAIAATIGDLRQPSADKEQAAFTDLVYEQMDAQKAQLWLGTATAQQLLQQEGWITGVDSESDVCRAAATLLGLPRVSFDDAPVVNWSGLKIEEAARLWDLWKTNPEGQSELDFINSQLALHRQNKTLPGLGEDLWIVNDLYLVAVHDGTVGICPLEDLKHLE